MASIQQNEELILNYSEIRHPFSGVLFRTGRHAPLELQKTSREYDKRGEFYEYKCTLFQTHFIRTYTICIGSAAHWKTRYVEYFIAVLWVSKYDEFQGLVLN